jgi:hypothetical protein
MRSGPAPPQATGLAFAKSGNVYVSLIGPNQIAVLDPSGNEIGSISNPLFHSPWRLAFSGKSLLVTSGDLEPTDNPAAWKSFKVAPNRRTMRAHELGNAELRRDRIVRHQAGGAAPSRGKSWKRGKRPTRGDCP